MQHCALRASAKLSSREGSGSVQSRLRSGSRAPRSPIPDLVVEGQDPPFDAWHAFLESDIGRTMTPAERRTLQAIPWAPGEEPTVAAYTMMLAGARLTQPRR